MNAYFYQDWQSEYSGIKVDDTNVLIRFAQNENLEVVTNLVTDIKYILNNDLAKQIFDDNNFDFDPLLYGYNSEKEWFEIAYKKLISETK
jgi:hypothetical protein